MKKFIVLVMALVLVFGLAGCGTTDTGKTLNVYFVPSRPADEILTITAPLSDLLKNELNTLGMDVAKVNIYVSSNYEAAGQALMSGTADIAFLPGGTYIEYKDKANSPVEVILAATRAGLNKDSEVAKDWNDGQPTTGDPNSQVAYYKGLIIAGTSAPARAVATKVNAGTALTWDDVKNLNWCIQSVSSSSGYIYPLIWLQDNFNKTYDDILGNVVNANGYGGTMANLAAGVCDVGTAYADARRDYADEWVGAYGRTDTIWDETDVIGVTSNIMNDTISVSTVNLTAEQITDIQTAFLNIADTQAGLDVMKVYSHQGYTIVTDSDYDAARAASAIVGN